MLTEAELDALWKERLKGVLGKNWRKIEKSWFNNQKQKWARYKAGANHLVYINHPDNTKVLKIAILPTVSLRYMERQKQLWDLVNPLFPSKIISLSTGRPGWICPFFQGRQATPKEIQNALLKIYEETGRIVVDAMVEGNFLTTVTGETVCIDMDWLLQLEAHHKENEPKEAPMHPRRRNSITSLNMWLSMQGEFYDWFHKFKAGNPLIVTTIRALLFMKMNRPEISNPSFLDDETICATLAKSYNYLISLKGKCYEYLRRYLVSKKALTITQVFKTPAIIEKNIEENADNANQMARNDCSDAELEKINVWRKAIIRANSFEEIEIVIKEAQNLVKKTPAQLTFFTQANEFKKLISLCRKQLSDYEATIKSGVEILDQKIDETQFINILS